MKDKIYTQEKILKQDIKKLFDEIRVQWIMIVPHGYGKNAVDFLVNFRGRFISLETKVGNNKPTPLQWDWLIETYECGGIALVAYDFISVHEMIRAINRGENYECPYVITEIRRRNKL